VHDESRSVVIHPPAAGLLSRAESPAAQAAVEITAEDLIRLQNAEIAQLRGQLAELGDAASAISSIALSLLKMLIDKGYASERNEVTIPRWLHEQMVGAGVSFRAEPAGIRVWLRERGSHRVDEE